MSEERDAFGRRRLTDEERTELLHAPLIAIWSTLDADGRIHSVPVHYVHDASAGTLRVFTERDSVKAGNAQRTGRATLCVQTALDDGHDRRYVTAEGPVAVEPASNDDLQALHRAYSPDDDVQTADDDVDLNQAVVLVLRPRRWIAWSDAD
jgi:PPOX class probable F420-dependent enzyme